MATLQPIYWEQKSADSFVYKFPNDNITMGSVLTVNDSQEAYFYKNGTLYDKFGAGRHVLSSANLPLLQRIVNSVSGGETTFKANVLFVSKLAKRNILWGAGGMRIIDPYFEIPIKVSARGQYGIQIKDGALFILKFVGTQAGANKDLIYEQFRADVVEATKVTIARFMKEKGININELGTEYKHLSAAVSTELQNTFNEYGIELLNYNIEDISFNENDPGYKTVMEGIAERSRLNKLGVNYVQQKQLDISQTMAGNQGAGVFMGAGMGAGMGLGVGQQMGQQVGQMFSQTMQNNPATQAQTPPPPVLPSFYIAQDGQTTGPFRLDVVHKMVAEGKVAATTYVYKVGGTAWVAAAHEPEIAQMFSMLPPPPPQM